MSGETVYKWVKASEEKPISKKEREKLHIRYKGVLDMIVFIKSQWCWDDIETGKYIVDETSWSAIEWLKEIKQPVAESTPAKQEDKAIEDIKEYMGDLDNYFQKPKGTSQQFIFQYKTLGIDFNVTIAAKDLNHALGIFASKYHSVEEIYSIKPEGASSINEDLESEIDKSFEDIDKGMKSELELKQMIDEWVIRKYGNIDKAFEIADKMFTKVRDVFYSETVQWTDELIKDMIYRKLPVPDHYVGNVQKCLDEYKEEHKSWLKEIKQQL